LTLTGNFNCRYPEEIIVVEQFRLHSELAGAPTRLLPEMVQAWQMVLFSWCIMPDHLHLLLKDEGIVDFVRLFKGLLTPLARRLEHGRVFMAAQLQ